MDEIEIRPEIERYIEEQEKLQKRKGHGLLFTVGISSFLLALFMGSSVFTGFAVGGELSPYIKPTAGIFLLVALVALWIDLRRL